MVKKVLILLCFILISWNFSEAEFNCGVRPRRVFLREFLQRRLTPETTATPPTPLLRVALQKKTSNRGVFNFVVGGREAEPYSWPWMAAIFKATFERRKRFLCGSSIVSERYVLTAAHCFAPVFRNIDPSVYSVYVGGHDHQEGDVYTVTSVQLHPQYIPRENYHDIAVVQLTGTITYSVVVAPVCLPMDNGDLAGYRATIVGWGDTDFGGALSNVLREVSVPVVRNEFCNASYSSLGLVSYPRGIESGLLCAGFAKGGKDACQGDSGGPLLYQESGRWTLAGIVSYGLRCAEEGFPGIYTRVSSYKDWILQNTDLPAS